MDLTSAHGCATTERDEVDHVLAAWRRERPDLDTCPMEVWSRITRLAQLLDGARARAYAAHELQVWEFDVLAALRRAGDPPRLSPGRLVRETHVTSGTMTNRIDRLESRGLVRRFAHPSDGRCVLVELTAEGSARVDASMADLLAAERSLATGLGDEEFRTLGVLLRTLLISQGS
ncbi:MarR family transcriptional regulator TamR [Brooklawnia cerclae]|uniref:DNA-binding MarR family transcriptional regulator n=1 Tax=Brooklawnia cerclae TaxID=349934 RepID=A0ABX0SHJ7_9ACTN|nr:MarR family transcriptional regulator [Brooklawnia cerclae]NIH57875.1 DNA-binding MarR family transcriptional regulator [Brooklawnia cerclae]